MTTRDQQTHSADHVIVRAGEADIGVLAQVIAEAFFPLAVCGWLIPDGTARRAAFPAYFRLYVEHAITGPHLGRFLAFDQQLDRHHPAGVFHEHLAILAVRPDRQGQGTGTALLDARHADLEDQGIPAYLEASDERTRRIYLAHGYTDRGSPIEFAPGVRMYPMWRQPRPG